MQTMANQGEQSKDLDEERRSMTFCFTEPMKFSRRKDFLLFARDTDLFSRNATCLIDCSIAVRM